MRILDWRQADAGLVRACYQVEREYWSRALAWDTRWTWATIERARVMSALPGVLALDDDGRLLGWSFHVIEGRRLNIGGLVAATGEATAALLDASFEAAAAHPIEAVACFVLDRAPDLIPALHARGMDVEQFLYLSREFSDIGPPEGGPHEAGDGPLEGGPHEAGDGPLEGGPHEVGDGPPEGGPHVHSPVGAAFRRPEITAVAPQVRETADLLRASYPPDAARAFAPNGRLDEWIKYVEGLVAQRGCGEFDPRASLAVRDAHGLEGLALMTALSPTTAHLAQLAVRPDCRGRGLAAELLDHACARAAGRGRSRMTLLVGERNMPARRLYRARGFVATARFVSAVVKYPFARAIVAAPRQGVAMVSK